MGKGRSFISRDQSPRSCGRNIAPSLGEAAGPWQKSGKPPAVQTAGGYECLLLRRELGGEFDAEFPGFFQILLGGDKDDFQLFFHYVCL